MHNDTTNHSIAAEYYNQISSENKQALTKAVVLYGEKITSFAFSYLKNRFAAEDVCEDVFVALLIKKPKFDCEEKFKSYLYKTARNKCIDVLRKSKKTISLEQNANLSAELPLMDYIAQKEREIAVNRAIGKLPLNYKEVLNLVYFENLSITESAQILNKNIKQTYNLLCRAKQSLKNQLKKEGFDNEKL